MQKNFFSCKKNRKHSPKDGHQMVDVDGIPIDLFHTYCNNIFALQYAHIHNSYIDYVHTCLYSSLKH
jgi:hypothetical protein